LINSFACLIS